MRSLLLAMLSLSCACACDESHRVADSRTSAAPAAARRDLPAAPAARRELPPATPAAAHREPAPAAALDVPPAALVAEPANATRDPPAVAPVDPREATRRAAHDVLAQHCGECHEGHRPTAKPKALAIFDLDQPDWPSRFDEHKYKAALMRLSSKSAEARDTFIAF